MSERVLIIIDDPFELTSVGAALKLHSIDVVGEARKKSAAINLFRSMQPNVLLLDMHKTNESAIDIANAIRKESPTVGVVILVACADVRMFGEDFSQLPNGALLVLKNTISSVNNLCDAIAVSRLFGPDTAVSWVNGGITLRDKESRSLMSKLSDIQIETLRHVAHGLTNSEIGRLRFVSEKAIEQILSRIAMTLNIQPDHRKNMRVQIVNEYLKWIGAPTH